MMMMWWWWWEIVDWCFVRCWRGCESAAWVCVYVAGQRAVMWWCKTPYINTEQLQNHTHRHIIRSYIIHVNCTIYTITCAACTILYTTIILLSGTTYNTPKTQHTKNTIDYIFFLPSRPPIFIPLKTTQYRKPKQIKYNKLTTYRWYYSLKLRIKPHTK